MWKNAGDLTYMWFVTNGDVRMICPDDISCFLSVVKFPNEIRSLLAVVPPNMALLAVGGLGLVASFFCLSLLRLHAVCNLKIVRLLWAVMIF
jgi:hypothetical protein